MAPPRRLWCSCLVIDYLSGAARNKDECESIITAAKAGEIEIAVSALALAEVAYLGDEGADVAEAKIAEFFRRDYVVVAQLDFEVGEEARRLVRAYKDDPKLKPLDAAHLAAAIRYRIPLLETEDDDLLRLDNQEGTPPVRIRRPTREEAPVLQPSLFPDDSTRASETTPENDAAEPEPPPA